MGDLSCCLPIPEHIWWEAQASLRRLGQSSVGLYQIHWPGFPVINNWATEAFVEGLATVQQAGLAKVGITGAAAAPRKLYDTL